MTDSTNSLATCVAKALANHDQTPFGAMTLTDSDGSNPREIDTRKSYFREARRF